MLNLDFSTLIKKHFLIGERMARQQRRVVKPVLIKDGRRKRTEDKHGRKQEEGVIEQQYIAEVLPEREIEVLTNSQRKYLSSMKHNIITIGLGVAGTGKSYVGLSYACEQLRAKRINKIILTRPGVEAGESYGFLPGDLEEKYEPYIEPMRDILYKRLGKTYAEYLIKVKVIDVRPLAYIRGSTFEDAIVILDEAQNCTPSQMKLFLTRIGENCKVIINGDESQKDIRGVSGLVDAVERILDITGVGITRFGIDDVVRSGICREIILAYH
jgi:phosphate starvation-inducible PhoH-like protein